MSILVLAEHDNQNLKPATLNALAAARQLGTRIRILVAGHNCSGVAHAAASLPGVEKVLLADHADYEHQLAENLAELLAHLAAGDTTHVLAAATSCGKNVLPRTAALLDVAQISDIIEVIDAQTFKRPIYAGNAIATVQSQDAIKVITVRTTAFDAGAGNENADSAAAEIETVEQHFANPLAAFAGEELAASDRPELTDARVVISGGRGLQSAQAFEMLYAIADKLGAAVGASRAAVDAGYVANDLQVGQTGKVVAPELYIAVGISGAIQHLAGMKDSKVIVAINKDEDAPIFQIADYGLVGDLFEILPKLEKLL